MSCAHWNEDTFYVRYYLCPHCETEVDVEFWTCSCYTGAYGTCPHCDSQIAYQLELVDVR